MVLGKPFELLLVSGLIILIGSLGLVDIFFISNLPLGAAAGFVFLYGFLHPLTAFFLFTGMKWVLKAARIFLAVSLLASFFYFGRLNNLILVVNALLYPYCLLYLFRYDIKTVFGED